MTDWVFLQAAYDRLPLDVFNLMLTYIPPKRTPPPPKYPGGLQRKVDAIQRSPKLTAMGLYGLEDFLLPK
jgi:hypothetical protein